jgi:hypothetical protein
VIKPTQVVDRIILGLLANLREHRRTVNEAARIRLRVAFDLGVVEPHRSGWSGDPLVKIARLVDAYPLRQALDENRSLDLAAVVSDVLFETVVRHGYGYIGPACFQSIRVKVKELDARAWLHVPPAGTCGRCDKVPA